MTAIQNIVEMARQELQEATKRCVVGQGPDHSTLKALSLIIALGEAVQKMPTGVVRIEPD